MTQEIFVQTPESTIFSGIHDFKNILYAQTNIKPEVYLPVLAYLNQSIFKNANQSSNEKSKKDKSKDKEEVVYIKTPVECNNSAIIDNAEKIKNLLYNQTKIHPEVYLYYIKLINEYVEILQYEEKFGIQKPNLQQSDNENTCKQDDESDKKQDYESDKKQDYEKETKKETSKDDININNLKAFK